MLIYKNCKAFYLGGGYWNITGGVLKALGFEQCKLKGSAKDVFEHINAWINIKRGGI